MHHMRQGDFAAAWELSDAGLRARSGVSCWDQPRHLQHVWDGTPPDGRRVLVRCYHGLGDTVQFIRYAPWLRRRAAEVIVWAQPALLPLLAGVPGVDRLLPLHDGRPEAAFDVDVEIMELPHLFRSTLDTLPNAVPYLHAPAPIQRRPDAGLHVGLVWRSGDWDPTRSVPLSLLAPLARIPGVTLHALQGGAALAEWPAALGPVSGSARVELLAGMMGALDLVLSVDSFPAHLAGALGRPVWTLLPAVADWRWMAGREDSPWYPTMRLLRQDHAGDWEPVAARVDAALRDLARRAAPDLTDKRPRDSGKTPAR